MKPALRSRILVLCLFLAVQGPLALAQTGSLQFTNLSNVPEGLRLMWDRPGTTNGFTLQFQNSLQDGVWRIPPEFYPFPSRTNAWIDPASTNASRFYRLIQVTGAERGKLISSGLSNTYSVATLKLLFTLAGITNVTVQYPVRVYKVVYETITPLGDRTVASGALCLPENVGKPLPLLSYQHGTIARTNDAPSSLSLQTELSVGVAFAANGYASAVPDYLGLGVSPGLHPYHHARSEATACVDMLRAVRTVCANSGFVLTNRLFLCGYSQGGHSTMALLRELEWHHSDEFTVTACAPMAGAYDLSGITANDFLSTRVKPNPYYFLYLLAAYQEVYHLAPTLADLLVAPYNTTLPPLMAGNSTGTQINSQMPADPTLILKPEYLAEFKADPRHPLRIALEDNDVYRWRPSTPLHFYHCAADQDVLPANTEVAVAYLQSLGLTNDVYIDPLSTADHGGCAQPSMLGAKAWFDSLR